MAFVPWGGSELLWSTTAERLATLGHEIFASVPAWPERPEPINRMTTMFGIQVAERPRRRSIAKRIHRHAWRALTKANNDNEDLEWLERARPHLLCISSGNATEGKGWMCLARDAEIPFVTLAQAHAEFLWPDDATAADLRLLYGAARRCFFVSEANQKLLEMQIAMRLSDAEVVRNPFNVSRDAKPEWPPLIDGKWRLACVARLHPPAKGQDLILEVLSRPEWRERPLSVAFYGDGPQEENLRKLSKTLEIEHMVEFRGHLSDVEQIWHENHALILPSRYEGLPVALVEALMCGRPAIVTDVAGNTEVVDDGVTGFVAEAPASLHLNRALERAWAARRSWQSMGQAAYAAIRQTVPPDPPSVFASRLLDLAEPRIDVS